MANPIILDCTPQMADVVSGGVPRPRERRSRENAFRWLADATPIMARLEREFPEFATRWPDVAYRPDVKPPTSLGLTEFPNCYLMTWQTANEAQTLLLFVNADGTRCALLDPVAALSETWAKLERPTAGRPLSDSEKPKTLYQRERRQKLRG